MNVPRTPQVLEYSKENMRQRPLMQQMNDFIKRKWQGWCLPPTIQENKHRQYFGLKIIHHINVKPDVKGIKWMQGVKNEALKHKLA